MLSATAIRRRSVIFFPGTNLASFPAKAAFSPLRLEIRGGRLVRAESSRKDLEREFWDYCHTGEDSDRIGELAFGDPYGSQTHAHWNSVAHIDVLTRNCDVWFDDEPVISAGRFLLTRLVLA